MSATFGGVIWLLFSWLPIEERAKNASYPCGGGDPISSFSFATKLGYRPIAALMADEAGHAVRDDSSEVISHVSPRRTTTRVAPGRGPICLSCRMLRINWVPACAGTTVNWCCGFFETLVFTVIFTAFCSKMPADIRVLLSSLRRRKSHSGTLPPCKMPSHFA